jgi:ribose-phosphate pyrophosphokinase
LTICAIRAARFAKSPTRCTKRRKRIYACFTHAVLSGRAIENFRQFASEKIIVTNTIPLCEKGEMLQAEGRIEVLSVAKLLASGIKSIHDETSVSSLFI